jgi:hypothetical protein
MYAEIHQLEPLLEGRASIADGRARLVSAHAQVRNVDLSLVNRAGGNVLYYLGSVLVPPSFLATEGEAVTRELQVCATTELADQLARRTAELAHQLQYGEQVTDIVLAEGFRIRKTGRAVRFRADVLLRRRASERLAAFTVSMGEQTVRGEFSEGSVEAGPGDGRFAFVRYPLDVTLPLDEDGSCLNIEIVAGGRDRASRSFCVPLSWNQR